MVMQQEDDAVTTDKGGCTCIRLMDGSIIRDHTCTAQNHTPT